MTSWQRFKQDWQGKKVLIMGLGLHGRGVGDAQTFVKAGAQVTVTDIKTTSHLKPSLDKLNLLPIRFVLGQHQEKDFLSADIILRNPDVDYYHPLLIKARTAGIHIKMDSSLFAKYCPLPIIGITGTRGKTTTTTMIYQLLNQLKPPVFLGGNIPGSATLSLLKKLKSPGLVVLELSSWELQGWHDEHISPHIAVFTNLYPDHLNRYSDMDEYLKDKLAITQYQTASDWLVLNQDNDWCRKLPSHTQAHLRWFSIKDLPENYSLQVPGQHNRANAVAALAVADILNLNHQLSLRCLSDFSGVPYRLETIAVIQGITFVNDTTSTTPVAGIFALESTKPPIILIAGGSDKNLDLTEYGRHIANSVKAVYLLTGSATPKLVEAITSSGGSQVIQGIYSKFAPAFLAATSFAKPGDTILLSPGCTSFGMFQNEFDRGHQFNQLVKSFKS